MLEGMEKLMESLKAFDEEAEVVEIIAAHTDEFMDMQRQQWMEGRGADGDYIRPFYSENPYFKTKEAAEHYADWKQLISPNPKRPKDVPNLYINGYLHRTTEARVEGQLVELSSSWPESDEIFAIHHNAIGLDPENALKFSQEITIPEFGKVLLQKTGIKI